MHLIIICEICINISNPQITAREFQSEDFKLCVDRLALLVVHSNKALDVVLFLIVFIHVVLTQLFYFCSHHPIVFISVVITQLFLFL